MWHLLINIFAQWQGSESLLIIKGLLSLVWGIDFYWGVCKLFLKAVFYENKIVVSERSFVANSIASLKRLHVLLDRLRVHHID